MADLPRPFPCFAAFDAQQKTNAITTDTREFGGGEIRYLMDEATTFQSLTRAASPITKEQDGHCSQRKAKLR